MQERVNATEAVPEPHERTIDNKTFSVQFDEVDALEKHVEILVSERLE